MAATKGAPLIKHPMQTRKTRPACTEVDPSCAIAYWGIAISQRPNPLVGPFDDATLKRGLEALRRSLAEQEDHA